MYLSFLDVLTHAIMVIDEHGYLTKDNSYIYGTTSTADRIKESLYSEEVTAEATAEAINTIEWMLQQEKTKFNNEITEMIEHGIKSINLFGMVASIVNNYRKTQLIKGKENVLNEIEFITIDSDIIMTRQKVSVTYINNYKPIQFNGNIMNFISATNNHVICYRKKGFKTKKGKEYKMNGVYEKVINFGIFNPILVKYYKLT